MGKQISEFDEKMKQIVASQAFDPEDELSELIKDADDGELSRTDLFLVSAATKPEIDRFREFVKRKEKQ